MARYLLDRRLTFYLPQALREGRTPGGRKTRSVMPLFPGYVFFYGDDQGRVEALKGNRLANVLEVADQATLVRDLSRIHRLLASGLPVVPEPTYAAGTRVRVLSGPLSGLLGVVVRRGKSDRFVAIVHFLGQGASVELQDWQVERAENHELA